MSADLFSGELFGGADFADLQRIPLAPGAVVMRGRAAALAPALLADIAELSRRAPPAKDVHARRPADVGQHQQLR